MSRLAGLRVIVVGAGAVGSALAWRLAREGASVLLSDPAGLGDNASGVAAGMLAPAFECVLDPVSAGHFALLRAARDLWAREIEALEPFGGALDRSGAAWVGDEDSNAEVAAALASLGAAAESLTPMEAGRASKGLHAPSGAVFTPEDWRLEPRPMLSALRRAMAAAGGRMLEGAVEAVEKGAAEIRGGGRLEADITVLATGLAPALATGLPAEVGLLQPIKGQLTRLIACGPTTGPVTRAQGVYVAPSSEGAAVGATMEAGRADLGADERVMMGQLSRAEALYPDLALSVAGKAEVGIRSATPDGLPLAGPCSIPGILLALGARRNGWLLAPLIAEVVADHLAGASPGPWADLLAPARFSLSRPG